LAQRGPTGRQGWVCRTASRCRIPPRVPQRPATAPHHDEAITAQRYFARRRRVGLAILSRASGRAPVPALYA
jgi:hypothetical protein